MMVICWISW